MNGLADISLIQAVDLWTDLMEARSGDHAYGGDVAEIYVYRAMPFNPMVTGGDRSGPAATAAYAAAGRALHSLLRLFETRTHSTVTMEDGSDVDALLGPIPETHRIHLRVSPRTESRP